MGFGLFELLLLLIIFVVFYFVFLRPRQRKQKRLKALVAGLAQEDWVVVAGGIHGRVVALTAETATIEIAPGTNIDVERDKIEDVLAAPPATSALAPSVLAEPPPPPPSAKCPACGAALTAADRFCGACGHATGH